MKSQQHQPQHRQIEPSIFQATAIILVSLLISCAIILVSGAGNSIYDGVTSLLPKFSNNGKFAEISDYSNLNSILTNQPKISYNSRAKLIFLENSDMNCVNCARFHGYNSSNDNYSYKKLQKDFVEKGLIDYVFLDSLVFDSVEKHNSTYCVAEQNTKAFFEYKENVYKDYGQTFNLDKAKVYANQLRLDIKKFEDCYNSRKYESRVTSISNFTQDTLGSTSTPTFYVYRVQEKEVTKSDGSKTKENEYTKLTTIVGNQDYDINIKPLLEKFVEENK